MNFKGYLENCEKNKVKVRIPKLQREYVQGKNEKGIRFVEKIFEKLINEDKDDKLVLDLVYGVERNGYADPIDGQQRLTTLYLLYFYIGSREDETIDFLKNFIYETRDSSTDFCKKLLENFSECIRNGIQKNETPSVSITGHPRYRVVYDSDYTVKSMINMLDVIHHEYNLKNLGNIPLFARLNKIEFEQHTLTQFTLGDELYVIMNDRGKQLTAYENFKSSLIDWLQSNKYQKPIIRDFSQKLDTKWSDAFWKKLEKNEIKTDTIMYKIFCRYFYELCIENEDIILNQIQEQESKTKKESKSDFDSLCEFFYKEEEENYLFKKFRTVLDIINKNDNTHEKIYNDLNSFLDCITNIINDEDKNPGTEKEKSEFGIPAWRISNPQDSDKIQDRFVKDTLVLDDRAILYAFRIYCNGKKLGNLKDWKRFVWNYCEGVEVSASIENLRKVIIRLSKYKKYTYMINKHLKDLNIDNLNDDYEKYEIKKAKWIDKNPQMLGAFEEAERHPFLKGDIDWLVKDLDKFDTPKEFGDRWKIANDVFFNAEGFKPDNDYFVIRALLTRTKIDCNPKKKSAGTSIVLAMESKKDSHHVMKNQMHEIWDEALRYYFSITGKDSNGKLSVYDTMNTDIENIKKVNPNYEYYWGNADSEFWHQKLCQNTSDDSKKDNIVTWLNNKRDGKRLTIVYPHDPGKFRINLGTNGNDPKIYFDYNRNLFNIETAINNNSKLENWDIEKRDYSGKRLYYFKQSGIMVELHDNNGDLIKDDNNKNLGFKIWATSGEMELNKSKLKNDPTNIIKMIKGITQ